MILWQKIALGVSVIVGMGFAARSVMGSAIARRLRKPAREMSLAEAHAELLKLSDDGALQILADGPRMTLGSSIYGVRHVYYDGAEHPRASIDNLDPRFAVYLARLDQRLEELGIDTLLDLGITHGGSNPNDVHNQGRAIDVAGVKSSSREIDLNVYRDWGKKPEKGTGVYRLTSDDAPGFDIFREIYDFGVREGADRSEHADQGGPPSEIGFGGYLITPDHPNPKLHHDHQNHMHMQLGRTQGVEP